MFQRGLWRKGLFETGGRPGDLSQRLHCQRPWLNLTGLFRVRHVADQLLARMKFEAPYVTVDVF